MHDVPVQYGAAGHTPPTPQGPNSAHGVGNVSLLHLAWRRKGLLVFFLLCGLGGGYWFYTQQDDVFQSRALVKVYRQQATASTGSAVEEIQDLVPGLVFIEAEITGDDVLTRAAEIGQLSSFPGMPAETPAVVARLRGGLKIEPPFESGSETKEGSMVLVIYESGDPALCSAAVNAVVQAYEEYVQRRHTEAIDSVVSFFEQAKGTILPQLDELETEYTDFRGSAPLEWTADGNAINPFREDALRLETLQYDLEEELRKVDTKLKLIKQTTQQHQNAVAVLEEVRFLVDDVVGFNEMQRELVETPNSEVELKTKLMGLRVQAALLAEQYAANHPQRLVVEKQLAATEKEWRAIQAVRAENEPEAIDFNATREEAAKSLLRSYISGLTKKRQLVQEDLDGTLRRLSDVQSRAHALIEFENKNVSFQRRITRFQDMLDSFDSQLEKASLPLLNPGLQVTTLRPAGLGFQIGPELAKILLVASFLGLACGGALAWLVDWSERTFRSPDEIAQSLGIPILTHMPLMLLSKKSKLDGDDAINAVDRVVTTVHDPHSPGAEAIRSVRTSLFATPSKEAEYQIIQVTSALPGDGKSTVAANLASSVSKANKRVLIIDADLRRPTQSSLFGIDPELGLTDVLNGDCEPLAACSETAVPGLYVMATGPQPNNPAEALMLPEFGQTLDDLRSEFDLIIVDTPPMLSVTDASNVATHVDGVMFVMRIGRNVKPMSKRATTMLKALHVNIIGVIVNAIGDSGYSATYANAWSDSYGGQPGSEYGYGYYRYGSDRYLNASRGHSVTVRGKQDNQQSRRQLVEAAPPSNGNGRHDAGDSEG